jgi:hypothetical protein
MKFTMHIPVTQYGFVELEGDTETADFIDAQAMFARYCPDVKLPAEKEVKQAPKQQLAPATVPTEEQANVVMGSSAFIIAEEKLKHIKTPAVLDAFRAALKKSEKLSEKEKDNLLTLCTSYEQKMTDELI